MTRFAERTVHGPDGKKYVTLESGCSLSIMLSDLKVDHVFRPFYNDIGKRRPSAHDSTLAGLGSLLGGRTLCVAGRDDSRVAELLVRISGYNEDNPEGRSSYMERAREGWPADIGVSIDEDVKKYSWYAKAQISQEFSSELIEFYLNNRLISVQINLDLELFVRDDDRYSTQQVYYLVPIEDSPVFPSTAFGFVHSIIADEREQSLKQQD